MRLAAILLVLAAPFGALAGGPEPLIVEAALADQLPNGAAWTLVAADGRRWQQGFGEEPILPGSLLKPFAALAWLESNPGKPPTFECRGEGCWLPSGHGEIGLTAALAHSCNSYFSRLILGVDREQIAGVALRYGLPPPPAGSPDAWWGWGSAWRLSPVSLLEAYQELGRRHGRANALVLEGLRQAAASGTAGGIADALESPALAKTGTAPCRHPRQNDGDGLAIIVYPASNPRYTMLLRACGRTGRQAAAAAGLALAKLTGERGREKASGRR